MEIDATFKDLIPPLTAEEYAGLEQSIINEGCRESIIIWKGIIVDGHNRYEICKKHGINFNVTEKNFDDKTSAKIWIVRNQFCRRNINNYQRAELGLKLKEILEEKSKEKEALRKTISQTKPIDTKGLNGVGKAIIELLSHKNPGRVYATPDNIYFVQNEDKVKIGCSCNIDNRLKDINKHLPDARLIGYCKGDISLEKSLHKALHEHRLNGEWFKINNTTVSIIKAFVPDADFDHLVKVNSREEIAEIFHTSGGSLSRVKAIREKAKPEIIEKLRKNEMSVNEAYTSIKRQEKEDKRQEQIRQNEAIIKNNPAPLPKQKYKSILIDPPWDWGDEGDVNQLGRAKPTYQTMSFEQLLDLPICELSEDNAHIYLWITNRSLPKGFALLEKWGFRYVTTITWGKPSYGMGNYFRGQTEHLLFGVKGSLPLLRKDVGTLLLAGRGEKHSSKPDESYRLIESCSPGTWLEMFARKKRDGWVSWGAEIV